MSAKPVIVVDALIGAGKSVLLEMLVVMLFKLFKIRAKIVKEPVEKWKKSGILDRFYKDPKRWGYHFQTKAFYDRVKANQIAYEEVSRDGDDTIDLYILERSCFTDRLFMELLHESGMVDDLEMADYRDWADMWEKVMPYSPDLFVYLKPSVDACMSRLRERNRGEEVNVKREYQVSLQAKHDAFFDGGWVEISPGRKVPVVTLMTDANFRDDDLVKVEVANFFERLITPLMERYAAENRTRSLLFA
jgi:deoxyadenosine/deoxycytidine kinase